MDKNKWTNQGSPSKYLSFLKDTQEHSTRNIAILASLKGSFSQNKRQGLRHTIFSLPTFFIGFSPGSLRRGEVLVKKFLFSGRFPNKDEKQSGLHILAYLNLHTVTVYFKHVLLLISAVRISWNFLFVEYSIALSTKRLKSDSSLFGTQYIVKVWSLPWIDIGWAYWVMPGRSRFEGPSGKCLPVTHSRCVARKLIFELN